MDISKLLPFVKKALMKVSPEEVATQLRKQEQSKQEDKQRETVDNEVIEQDENPSDDQDNQEGQLIEGAFKELEVEDAIDQAREEKMLAGGQDSANVPGVSAKTANYWTILKRRIK